MEAFMDSVTVHSDHRGTIVLLKERLTGPYEWASSSYDSCRPAGNRQEGPSRRRAARAESTLPTGLR